MYFNSTLLSKHIEPITCHACCKFPVWFSKSPGEGEDEILALELACALCHAVTIRPPSDCLHPLPVLEWEAFLVSAVKLDQVSCGRGLYGTQDRVENGSREAKQAARRFKEHFSMCLDK